MDYALLTDTKKAGGSWTDADIRGIVDAIVSGELQGEQLGAMLMLICLQGMDASEMASLTAAMTSSGERLTWPESVAAGLVDKHSTGGVGDKVSLALLPTVVSQGCKVPMITGRALGFTGGTVDKLESVPGFSTQLTKQRMLASIEQLGGFFACQTESVAPADRIVYAARSRTNTINSNPLIVASILSKKAAESIGSLVMDVKFGSAAFMETFEAARSLATDLKSTGEQYGMQVVCVLSEMSQPLGKCVGPALEMAEALQLLNGIGCKRLLDLISTQAGHMLHMCGAAASPSAGQQAALTSWTDGSALATMRSIMINQGVTSGLADQLCSRASHSIEWYLQVMGYATSVTELRCSANGYVGRIETKTIGKLCNELAAGQEASSANRAAGVEIMLQIGDKVQAGTVWCRLYHPVALSQQQEEQMSSCLIVQSQPPAAASESLIREII